MDIDQEREFRKAAMAWLDKHRRRGHERMAYAELAEFRHP